jgi:hypothetical protein
MHSTSEHSEEVNFNHRQGDQGRLGQVSQARLGQVRLCQVKLCQVRSGQVRSG